MKKRLQSKYTFQQVRGIQKLDKLSWVLGERIDYLIELAAQKNNYYKPFVDEQPGKKPREIDQPTGELLRVQTKIRDRLLDLIPLSRIVFGAVEGKSTKMSAEVHLKKDVVVKLDLKDCYHSSKARRVKQLFKNRFGFSERVSVLLTELCTFQGSVPVGSTLSATLVNLILNPLWDRIDKYRSTHGMGASTWVDDLAISGKSAEKHIEAIKKMINSYGYRISWNKKEIQRKSGPQIVNGGGVNTNRVTVPKKKRLEIAKALKEDPHSDSSLGKLVYAKSLSKSQGGQLEKLKLKLVGIQKS
ncbi:MAG: reverse transcriptase family protein [Patescibacteria group bacterium]